MRTSTQAKKLALFASGAGSNVRRIHEHFQERKDVNIALLVSNKPGAPVVTFAGEQHIPVRIMTRDDLLNPQVLVQELLDSGIDLIVLAGFLWKIPHLLIQAFPDRIMNLHPALLPRYGGKGMYGMRVHEAILQAKEKESGITIHLVNEEYDEGRILFQARCPVHAEDRPEDLAERIHQLEHQHLPFIIDLYLSNIS
ncbi:MAG: phosphoribosylglycinamide formyltransferase [Saprospiraceae bacterium]|nr:phosphoribosylglycinamide formyltransferase [Saprospiraceae bacterium]